MILENELNSIDIVNLIDFRARVIFECIIHKENITS